MTIKINEYELNDRNVWQNSKTLKRICNHINGFGEEDYKHIADGILKILKDERIIK